MCPRGSVGVLLRLLGEPLANLPGVVQAAHRDGLLGHEEAPAMAAISIAGIAGGGSLGPEAPLVSIGGGLASFVCIYVDLSEAETLFVTMTGMGAGLAAFFGEPIGGALFACEVLHRYGLEYYEAVLPTVIAGLACTDSNRHLHFCNLYLHRRCAVQAERMKKHEEMERARKKALEAQKARPCPPSPSAARSSLYFTARRRSIRPVMSRASLPRTGEGAEARGGGACGAPQAPRRCPQGPGCCPVKSGR